MRPIIALALLASLCACQPQDPDGQAAIPPADAPPPAPESKGEPKAAPSPAASALPAEFTGELDAVGTEPFWSLAIRRETLTLSRPDAPDVATPAGIPVMQGTSAVWATPALTVTLSKGDCSDGMSDRKFPLIAEVKLGATTLTGCAAKAGAAQPAQ